MYTIVEHTETKRRARLVDSRPLSAFIVYQGEENGQWVEWEKLEIIFG